MSKGMPVQTISEILIVDDDAAIRYSLERILKRDGHQVVAVESGEAALERIAVQDFDLALVDLKLKGISGIEVLTALRRQRPATPVIVLTGHATLETAVEALRQGAHDYLFKPCATIDLRESIRAGLLKRQQELQRRKATAQPQPAPDSRPTPPEIAAAPAREPERFLRYGGLIIDPIRHVVTIDGKLLELTLTEFGLLAYLVSEAPRVVSSRELVREVQGYESESWEARDIVRSHIYHIRSKIKAAAGRDVIRTVRGVGYALGE